MSGSVDRLEELTDSESRNHRSRNNHVEKQPEIPQKQPEPEVVEPSPKLRYETVLVHMSDCPTIRADCVSSNRVVVNWTTPGEKQECPNNNVADHNVTPVTSSVKKRRNRTRQKSLPADRLDECVYAAEIPHYFTLVPADNCPLKSAIINGGVNCYDTPTPPHHVPLQYDVSEPMMSYEGNVVGETCWQFERRRSKSCQRMTKKRMSIQAEAIQLEDEPPPPPPPPIFCGPEVYDQVLPSPPQMMSTCDDDNIVAIVEDHRHRERRRPPMPAPQPKPRTIFQTHVVPRSRSKSSSNLLADRRSNNDSSSNTNGRKYR